MYYEPHIPKGLLSAAGPATGKMDINNTQGHFALVNHQLKEVSMLVGWCVREVCLSSACRVAKASHTSLSRGTPSAQASLTLVMKDCRLLCG